MSFPKALIIGLGGLGSDIVCSTYQRFKNHSAHTDHHKRVKFLALDTDANEVNVRKKIMPPENVIQTSSTESKTAGQYIDEIKDISTVTDWFPIEASALRNMSINDGAGQIRTISRLAYSHAIQTDKTNRIKTAITELLNLNVGEGDIIDVHIVCSLAGGTGAGSFLQTAYLVKELLPPSIANPKIFGYFMLGDVFLRDPEINLADPVKRTNILANTYACIKELNGIFEIEDNESIDFEYGSFSRQPFKITSASASPFTQCFLCDYENNQGGNIGSIKNYKKQIEDFLYLNTFSPTGDENRSEAINNIFKRIQDGPSARYGASGIAKIVYPIDNLLDYFSVKRLSEKLKTTWLKIDNAFDEKRKEYNKNQSKGIQGKEPILSEFFIDNVYTLAHSGQSREQLIFQNIWRSTQTINTETNKIIDSKANIWLEEVDSYLTNLRDKDAEISFLGKIDFPPSFTSKEADESNDLSIIQDVENKLNALNAETFDFIENTKRIAVEEIFVKDKNSIDYYNPEIKHRINNYILEEKKAMHPIAQRYFFYEILKNLKTNYEQLKESNKTTLAFISNYDSTYDVKEDDQDQENNYVENAIEAYQIYLKKDAGIIKRFMRLTGGASNLADFKKDYVSKSQQQNQRLKDYALSKLQEYVYGTLIIQINKILKNLEGLFATIPAVNINLNNKMNALATLENTGNKSVIYVLAKENHREHIYQNVVAKDDSIFFPEEISRDIYEEVYLRTCEAIDNPMYYAQQKSTQRIRSIFEEMVVNKQKEDFKENFKDDFAGYNIMEAMQKEAQLEETEPMEHIKAYFSEIVRMATPFGAKYTTNAPKINAWAIHPECTQLEYLSEEEADDLFNNVGVAQENASRVVSDYFERTEIIREETVMVLKVPQNFPKFSFANSELHEYSTAQEGIYYTYYKNRMEEIQNNPTLPSPHLDKRWGSPKYFRDLGKTAENYKNQNLKAFLWGLVQGNITVINYNGSNVWAYSSPKGFTHFIGENNRPLKSDVYSLLKEGLPNNEKIVEEINAKAEIQLHIDKQNWQINRTEGKSILSASLLTQMKDFKFENGKNILSVFNGLLTTNDSEAISILLNEINSAICTIAGNKGENTKQEAKNIIHLLIKEIEEGATLSKNNVETLAENSIHQFFES